MLDRAFNLQPSKRCIGLIGFMVLGTMAPLLWVPLRAGLKAGIALLVLAYGATLLYRYGLLQHPQSVIQLRRLSDGSWRIHTLTQFYEAHLRGDSTVTRAGAILRFNRGNEFFTLTSIVLPDALPAHQYRQLQVLLRSSA